MTLERYAGAPPTDGLLYFTATWCGPCRVVKPELQKLKDVRIVEVDIDQHHDVADRWAVTAVPTFLRFAGGEVAGRAMGAMRAKELREFLSALAVTPSRIPPLVEPVFGTKRRATVVVRYRLAEAMLEGVKVADVDPDEVYEPTLGEVEGASDATVRSFVQQLVDGGYARSVPVEEGVDAIFGTVAAHTRVTLTRSGTKYLRAEAARLRRLVAGTE